MKLKKIIVLLTTVCILGGLVACSENNISTNIQNNVTENDINSDIINNLNNDENDVEVNTETTCPYTMLVNDVEHKFPMTYEEFLGKGWELTDSYTFNGMTALDAGEMWTLAGDYSNNAEYEINGAEGIQLIYRNSTDKQLKLKECKLIGMVYDERLSENFNLTPDVIKFTDGTSIISIGTSTLNDVQSAFGEPNYIAEYEDNEITEFRNEKETHYTYIPEEKEWMLSIVFDENGVSKYFSYFGEY